MNWSAPFETLAVGDAFTTPARTVTESDVIGFAALTGDWHPQHADPAWAAASPFGERIAHGMLVVSLAVGSVPFDPERVLALRRVGDVVFKRPVRFGDEITVAGKVAGLRPVDDQAGLVDWTWRVTNQEGALVCRAGVEVLWRRGANAFDAGDPFTTPDGDVLIPL